MSIENEIETETPKTQQVDDEKNVAEEQQVEELTEPKKEDVSDEEEVVVSFGDEEQKEPQVDRFPDLRKRLSEEKKEKIELKKKLEALESKFAPVAAPEEILGPKPTLESCDFNDVKFEKETDDWYQRKIRIENKQREIQAEQDKQNQAWQEKLTRYNKLKDGLKTKDFEDAEYTFLEMFDKTQQGIILHGANDPAQLVYALGKYPEKAKDLANEKDPILFAMKVERLQGKINITRRTPEYSPQPSLKGSGGSSGGSDAVLAKLRKEADATGDRTHVISYIRQMKKKH